MGITVGNRPPFAQFTQPEVVEKNPKSVIVKAATETPVVKEEETKAEAEVDAPSVETKAEAQEEKPAPQKRGRRKKSE